MNYPTISIKEVGDCNTYELSIDLPSAFNIEDEILGISMVCPYAAFKSEEEVGTDMGNDLCLLETTNGFFGISMTDEQVSTLVDIFVDSASVAQLTLVDYPIKIPTADNTILASYLITGSV